MPDEKLVAPRFKSVPGIVSSRPVAAPVKAMPGGRPEFELAKLSVLAVKADKSILNESTPARADDALNWRVATNSPGAVPGATGVDT